MLVKAITLFLRYKTAERNHCDRFHALKPSVDFHDK